MPTSTPSKPTAASDIQTLSELYAAREIPLRAQGDKPIYAYDEALNTRVSIWRGELLYPMQLFSQVYEIGG